MTLITLENKYDLKKYLTLYLLHPIILAAVI